MLTYEALLEQAKSREMPPTKIRGILREYLQILILKEIYKIPAGKKLYFTGGTYLRLIHNLKRFSEDLDFNSNKITKLEFEQLLKKVKNELKRIGLKPELEFSHWENLCVAKLIFPQIEQIYKAKSKYSKKEGIIIKIESFLLEQKINTETEVATGFGQFYPCISTDKSILFADKIDALRKKNRGRHIYDIIFMLSNKYTIDKSRLKALGINTEPFKIIAERINDFSKKELKKQADSLQPFLFDETQADLVKNAQTIIPSLLEKY
jgi:predicted nucleotidyltransferase component of viral defense system